MVGPPGEGRDTSGNMVAVAVGEGTADGETFAEGAADGDTFAEGAADGDKLAAAVSLGGIHEMLRMIG